MLRSRLKRSVSGLPENPPSLSVSSLQELACQKSHLARVGSILVRLVRVTSWIVVGFYHQKERSTKSHELTRNSLQPKSTFKATAQPLLRFRHSLSVTREHINEKHPCARPPITSTNQVSAQRVQLVTQTLIKSACRRLSDSNLFHFSPACDYVEFYDMGRIASVWIAPRIVILDTRTFAPSLQTQTSNRSLRISMVYRNTQGGEDSR